MKKLILFCLVVLGLQTSYAQYSKLNKLLNILEKDLGSKANFENVNIDNKKFVFVKYFDTHTERYILSLEGEKATYIELFDDKITGKTTSKIYSGDALFTKKGILSVHCDHLEGQKTPNTITKNFIPAQQRDIIYLIELGTEMRWISDSNFKK